MNNGVDIIVVSTACHTAINRRIYKEFVDVGVSVLLVVPTELTFSSGVIVAAPPVDGDPLIEYIDLQGANPRFSRFVGIKKILDQNLPKLIILDSDPASVMGLQLGLWAVNNKSKLYCITCENMPLGLVATYRRRGVKVLPFAIIKRLLLISTRKLVHGVFTINNEGTAVFKNEGFSNVKKIPLGFDSKYFRIDLDIRKSIRSKLGLSGFVIGFFGRITYEKGVHILLEAMSNLVDEKWTLLMDEFDIYKSKYGEDIKDQIHNSGLSERIVFINPTHAEMGEFINAVDVVVMPSISTPIWVEQYGRIAAEAMACGKVVVASNAGAFPMLLNGRGILFEEGDVIALSDILKRLMHGVKSQEFSCSYTAEEISAYAHAELDVQKQMEIMLSLFEETNAL